LDESTAISKFRDIGFTMIRIQPQD
jgi:hypothetical protein